MNQGIAGCKAKKISSGPLKDERAGELEHHDGERGVVVGVGDDDDGGVWRPHAGDGGREAGGGGDDDGGDRVLQHAVGVGGGVVAGAGRGRGFGGRRG